MEKLDKTKENKFIIKDIHKYFSDTGTNVCINFPLLIKDYPELLQELQKLQIPHINLVLISFLTGPTGNCQLNSLQFNCYNSRCIFIQKLLKSSKLKQLVVYLFNNLKKFSNLNMYFNTRGLLLLDLNEGIAINYLLNNINEENIVIKQQYKSTNNSNMMLILVKTKNLFK